MKRKRQYEVFTPTPAQIRRAKAAIRKRRGAKKPFSPGKKTDGIRQFIVDRHRKGDAEQFNSAEYGF